MKLSEIYSAYMYSYPHKTAYHALTNVDFSDYKGLLGDSPGSLYFHVPFCKSKCGYCNLFSVTGQSEEYMTAYIEACEIQMRQYNVPPESFQSLTVGGGDPLLLPSRLLTKLLSIGGEATDICVETSPNETSRGKLSILRQFGARRVSIGVQSFCDSELAVLKRTHSAYAAKTALSLLKESGFPSVNLDLIYGIPGQTDASLEFSLREAVSFAPDEIFIYPLYIRSGTALSEEVINENTYAMYFQARDYLLANGYFQTSMRQFVKSPPENPKTCGFENMLAIGCGGRSYIGNLHFCYPYALDNTACLDIIDGFIARRDKTEIRHGYILNEDELKRRFIIKNLLYFKGVSGADYHELFHTEVNSDFPVLHDLLSNGCAEIFEDRIRLTPLGLSLSDSIGHAFVSDAVKADMEAWHSL